jgi:hypothetical protein
MPGEVAALRELTYEMWPGFLAGAGILFGILNGAYWAR